MILIKITAEVIWIVFNIGFNKLVVHNSDNDCITTFHGSYRKSGGDYIHFTNEKYESK